MDLVMALAYGRHVDDQAAAVQRVAELVEIQNAVGLNGGREDQFDVPNRVR
jgi:hypothetical protein